MAKQPSAAVPRPALGECRLALGAVSMSPAAGGGIRVFEQGCGLVPEGRLKPSAFQSSLRDLMP